MIDWLLRDNFTDMTVASMALTVNVLLSVVPTVYNATAQMVAKIVVKVRDSVASEGWDLKIANAKGGANANSFINSCKSLVDIVKDYENQCRDFCPRSLFVFRCLMVVAAIASITVAILEVKLHAVVLLFLPYPLFLVWMMLVGAAMVSRLYFVKLRVKITERKLPLDDPEILEKKKKEVIAGLKDIAKKGGRRK